MSYTLKTNTAKNTNYGSKRKTSAIKYIVIHFTANDGDTAVSNGKYFHNNTVKASAHYFVDSSTVVQSVPDNYVAWSVGGNRYSDYASVGGAKYYKKCTNANSISIELCDDNKNGTIYPSAKTIANALELTKKLMKKYDVPQSKVIRHFDITSKRCPAYWCGTTIKNNKWNTEFWNKLASSTSSTTTKKVTTTSSTTKGKTVNYIVKVTADTLNVRKGAGTSYDIVTTVRKDVKYTIVEELNGWGLLKSYKTNRNGWIYLKYTKKC